MPKKVTKTETVRTIEVTKPNEMIAVVAPIELIADVPFIAPQSLEWNDALAYDDIELQMDIQLGERLSMVEPLEDVPFDLDIQDAFFGNVGQTAKALYRRTAKAIMDVYHTADYRINEAKEELMAAR